MKITLSFEYHDGKYGKSIEVNAYMPFEMYGFTFAVHRYVDYQGLPIFGLKSPWRVAEISTGGVVSQGETRKEAIKNAKKKLIEIGEKKTRQKVNKLLRRQKKAGRA